VTGFFVPLLAWLEHMVREGFLKEKHRRLLREADEPDRLLDLLVHYRPEESVPKWITAEDR
jgi:predicted Rossmann-fold nucleotide-binding protein